MKHLIGVVLGFVLLTQTAAWAWTKPGHMVTAAIAYDDLAAHDRGKLARILGLLAHHPDHARFEAAVAGAAGRERDIRLIMECARWPDDARGSVYDHPTWHYADTAVVRAGAPADAAQRHGGDALDAVQLSLWTAANSRAPAAERALALCWLMHLGGDLHQPLHAASLYSGLHARGDAGGNDDWIIDPTHNEPQKLHGFWDGVAFNTDDSDAAIARARQLEQQYQRSGLNELQSYRAQDFNGWSAGESYVIAERDAYVAGVDEGAANTSAVLLSQEYRDRAAQIAERRIAVAGYRLADLLRIVAAGGAPH